MFGANVTGGTGAGSKWRPDPAVARCDCGRFIAPLRAAQGATKCVLCEAEEN